MLGGRQRTRLVGVRDRGCGQLWSGNRESENVGAVDNFERLREGRGDRRKVSSSLGVDITGMSI